MKKTSKPKPSKGSPIQTPARNIPDWTRTVLFTLAGGRCEFDGCHKYLLEHHLTFKRGNFSQAAHIVAFSKKGPRGDYIARPKDIHDVSNLMLLCPTCHKLVDNDPDRYPQETLTPYKKSHEEQILHLTGLRPEMKTTYVVLKTKIGDEITEVPFDHILKAVSPRYPFSKQGFIIDLTPLPMNDSSFTAAACSAIRDQIRVLLSTGSEVKDSKHLSVFALAPMPILAFLGAELSNKVPCDLFQRHRDTDDWSWKAGHGAIRYAFGEVQKGTHPLKVVLSLPLSGEINPASLLSAGVDSASSIYEIRAAGVIPSPTFLKTKGDLDRFRAVYQEALSAIGKAHPGLEEISLFMAVPAPVAILCGRELLPRAHPAIRLHDYDKSKGYFYSLTINAPT